MDTDGQRMRVLVVDDCRDTCTSMEWLLKHWGYETRTASDGKTALEVNEAFRPDVILLDIGLPDMDGLKVLRQMRDRKAAAWPFVICASGWANEETRNEAQEVGCDLFVVKPLDLDHIAATLRSIAVVSRIFKPTATTNGAV